MLVVTACGGTSSSAGDGSTDSGNQSSSAFPGGNGGNSGWTPGGEPGGDIPGGNGGNGGNDGESVSSGDIADENEVEVKTYDGVKHNYVLSAQSGNVFEFTCSDCDETSSFKVTYESGTDGAYSLDGTTLTFSGITEESVYGLSGTFYGNIVIDVTDDYKFELAAEGFSLISQTECPIKILSGDKVTLSAKKGTENYVYDIRDEVSDTDETAISASIYALCDLDIQGKGSLYVTSLNNNGIHTKDDLKVKNLFLQVDCKDNALKGNDSVTVQSGEIVLIARDGDGIKTSNSDLSSKGKQRGTVAISGGDILIYAARDGIDSAYDVTVDESSATVTLQIFTDKYSKYTESSVSSDSSTSETGSSSSSSVSGGRGPGGQGGFPGGGQGGQGGNDGNSDKSDVSTKGIKADNEITISAGTITVKAYDDAVHANSDTLENGETGLGNVNVAGGSLTLYSDDDGIHGDGTVTVSGGDINVVGSYEGLEGAVVIVSGGNVSVISSDDGLNGTGTSGNSIVISGGTLYVLAGGDGLDSNSTDSYGGIVFKGGKTVVISYGNADSSIDTERGYAYEGGYVLAVGKSGGMSGEATNSSPSISSIGKTANVNLSNGAYLLASGFACVKMPITINASVVVLGDTSASISSVSSADYEFDANGVYWLK